MGDAPTWLTVLSIVGLVVTLATSGAAVVAFFRASYAKATIETLKESNAAYSERLDQQDVTIAALQTEVEHYKASSAADRAKAQVLEQALSGKADFERLERLLDDHHREVMQSRSDDRELWGGRFNDVDNALGQVKGMIGARRRSEGSAESR